MNTLKFIIIALVISSLNLVAQTKQRGSIALKSTKKMFVEYVRTFENLKDTLHLTRYDIMQLGSTKQFELEVSHNPIRKIISINCMDVRSSLQTKLPKIIYKYSNAGLVFNNESNLDTAINFSKNYKYLVFFTDTSRTTVGINAFTTSDSTIILLDKVSKMVLIEHARISNGLLQNPSLAKLIQRQEKVLGNRVEALEKVSNESASKIVNLRETSTNMIEDLMSCRNACATMSANYDSLTNKVYNLEHAIKAYPTYTNAKWQKMVDSLINANCGEFFFENSDIKFVVKLTSDTIGNITNTDLVYPPSVASLNSKDNFLYSSICGMIKKSLFETNYVNVYGKNYAVKTTMDADIFISIKNRKDKVIYTDKDNMIFNDTKLPLSDDLKKQVYSKLYAGARTGKYAVKISSFTVNNLVKEIVKEIEY